jgi:hypothetical protein
MSNDIRLGMPKRREKKLATSAPAAGPDSIMRTGLRPAVGAPTTPPLDSMISGCCAKPRVASSAVSASR